MRSWSSCASVTATARDLLWPEVAVAPSMPLKTAVAARATRSADIMISMSAPPRWERPM
jgi:hypothetical protein